MTDISAPLPHGTTLHCRVSGVAGRPVLLFLHGFPEGAFIWDELLLHFSRPENGGYHCVAPYLRGFGPSSSPAEVDAYRAKHLVQDLMALIAHECPGGALECLVAHDWGGAVAWNLANQQPQLMKRLAYQPWVGLPNILCREFVVPELIQERCTPEALAAAVAAWLDDAPKADALVRRFDELHHLLRRDTARRAADAIAQVAEA